MARCRHSIIYKTPKPMPVFFVHIQPGGHPPHVAQQVTHANGTPVLLNYRPWDYRACECLFGLQSQIMDFRHEININVYYIRFDCMSPNAPKPTDRTQQIQKCLERMRAGKCPYNKLARQLFTDIERK